MRARNVKRANTHLKKSGGKLCVPKDTALHDLRHFYASVLIKNGATPKQVQMRLGQAKPSITLNVYTRPFGVPASTCPRNRSAKLAWRRVVGACGDCGFGGAP
ncbi:tyrosine-type recombinase/integrase [Streptomyces sp. NPDC046915]|uniref:tyrosine-type recombinase/integrase n=1 Tax=Streptomyces sp. NPDC046915 TaxID=3155257 RepID=UPI0033FEBD52